MMRARACRELVSGVGRCDVNSSLNQALNNILVPLKDKITDGRCDSEKEKSRPFGG